MNASAFPESPKPLSLLDKPLEAFVGRDRLQIDVKGTSLTIILGWSRAIIRIFPDGEVRTQGVGGGTPRADGADAGVKIAHMSPVIAKGLIRYAYFQAYSDSKRALRRTMEFIFNETPELFMAGWNRIYGHDLYEPKKFRPELDLDQ